MNYPYENLDVYTLPNLLNRSVALYPELESFGKIGEYPMSYKELGDSVKKMITILKKMASKKVIK